ncbi:MAG: hypothetical protein M1834_001521 [Cirrosporium novae-zelandiae]|nr:MAG: hypothetical protein M1834_004038 [Cirrosporium novae-zelandiae]KAI9735506.1 MAG: hypothetical protein M1834_001521 [Cirrosporium novae-zelandiae]
MYLIRAWNGRSQLRRETYTASTSTLLLLLLAIWTPSSSAKESCISLSGSTACPAFNASSISTNDDLVSLYPFLQYVSSRSDFDSRLSDYVSSAYVKEKYKTLLGCDDVDLSNTTDYYARYTTSVICNGIIQNSKDPCGLTSAESRPLCADSCALQATSEEQIVVNGDLCTNPDSDYMTQIRADFTNCALPADSLSGDCITGEDNEPDNCGYASNLPSLCDYCGDSSPNSTDSCCIGANATGLCANVTLPVYSSMPPLFTSATSSAASSATASSTTAELSNNSLSGGAIAGIVIGSIAGAALLLGLLIWCCVYLRRRKSAQTAPVFNQPQPQRHGPSMTFTAHDGPSNNQGYEVLPGGRVARMSALENASHNGVVGGGTMSRRSRSYADTSDSEAYGSSPEPRSGMRPPLTNRRHGSLSSNSVLASVDDPTSPNSSSNGQLSSPGIGSGQSEQLAFFKDYYSNEEIHPNDKVAVLWAYQPRAADEFELERGEMLKVVGIWDDGWATGVRVNDRVEDYDGKRRAQRDSGVSNGSRRDSSPPPTGEIKAFPLVCVCLPEHWRKTIEDPAREDDLPSP